MFSIFKQQNKSYEPEALSLYQNAMDQARLPHFYFDLGVPNTPDGRFEMIAMHVCLVIYRLNDEKEETGDLSQALFDIMFADMDQSLRQIGLGDMTVPKRMRYLMKTFNARMHDYAKGLDNDDAQALIKIIDKNIFGG